MQIYGVRVWVDDMDVARKFYGETLDLTPLWETGGAVGYDLGATLIVEPDSPEGDEQFAGRFVGVSIAVPNVQAAYDDLTAKGVQFLGPPEKMPWGGMLAHFMDPAGNTLTLVA